MSSIYNFGLSCYRQLIGLAAIRNPKAKKLIEGQKTVFSYLQQHAEADGNYIWFHASSLGEFEQGRPLMETLKKNDPQTKIIVTFFSPSGYEVRKNYTGADLVCYLPLDLPHNVIRFLNIVKPQMAIFIKYEFWDNYLRELDKRRIPTYLISAIFRPSQLFFKSYGGFYRNMLRRFTHLYIQDEASKKLLAQIGISNITVCGDTRFDRVIDISRQARNLPLVEQFVKTAPVTLVAGSSWPKDEEYLIEYFNTHPGLKMIIAPHEIHESHLKDIESRLKRPVVRYSATQQGIPENTDCLIIDCFGLLSSIYRYGQIAYIGGGFGAGIHNVTEAAVYGIPVIFGPKFEKFREARELITCGGAFTIELDSDLFRILDELTSQPAKLKAAGKKAGEYISQNAGATQTIMADVFTKKNEHFKTGQ